MKLYLTQDHDGTLTAWRERPQWLDKEGYWCSETGTWDMIAEGKEAQWLCKLAGVENPEIGKLLVLEVKARKVKR
jgi:hypothetical protein